MLHDRWKVAQQIQKGRLAAAGLPQQEDRQVLVSTAIQVQMTPLLKRVPCSTCPCSHGHPRQRLPHPFGTCTPARAQQLGQRSRNSRRAGRAGCITTAWGLKLLVRLILKQSIKRNSENVQSWLGWCSLVKTS